MSRTIRRAGADAVHDKRDYVGTPDRVDEWDLRWTGASSPAGCITRRTARFHCDAYRGYRGGVPRWYRRELNRRVKRLNLAEMRRCLARQCWDDHAPVPLKSNAGHYWW